LTAWPDAVIGPAIESTDHCGDLDRIVAHLGRSPLWVPPVVAGDRR